MIKRCEVCGREFAAKRSDAKCCSSKCRKRKMQGVPYYGTVEPPVPSAMMTDEEVACVIDQAHCTASDLARAAMFTSAPVCISLRTVARKLESALRSEGL